MSSLLITPSLNSAVVTAADAARITKTELLTSAAAVTTVKDRLDADDATARLRPIKDFIKTIEAARKEAKEPALEIGKRIDAMARELTADLVVEAARISRVLGAYEIEEWRKAEAARYAAEAEAARIAQEARIAEIKARRAAPDAEAADRAADAVVEKAAEQIVSVKQAAANAFVPKAAGTMVREDVCFEVEDITALYSSNPQLVILEPNGSAIRAILRSNPNLQIPGLRHWRSAKLNVR